MGSVRGHLSSKIEPHPWAPLKANPLQLPVQATSPQIQISGYMFARQGVHVAIFLTHTHRGNDASAGLVVHRSENCGCRSLWIAKSNLDHCSMSSFSASMGLSKSGSPSIKMYVDV